MSTVIENRKFMMVDKEDLIFKKISPMAEEILEMLRVCVAKKSWSSKRQQTISHSSAEAKYRGVANVIAETAWLRNLLREQDSPLSAATLVYCDNVNATYLSANPVQPQQTKHIDIDIHFVHDLVTAGQVRVLYVPSCYHTRTVIIDPHGIIGYCNRQD
nr:ribonuclease H-like domain-containing protein [Tanacetum cinerariifolium]